MGIPEGGGLTRSRGQPTDYSRRIAGIQRSIVNDGIAAVAAGGVR